MVTVRHGEGSPLHDVRLDLEAHPDLLGIGPSSVLYAIADRIVDDYLAVIDGIAVDVEEVEAEVFSGAGSNPAERIYRLKREVLEFRRAVTPLIAPMQRLSSKQAGLPLDPRTEEYFRDVHDHLVRDAERIAGFDELLTNVLQANVAQITMRDNQDMRRISAWVAIIAVPTMVFGLYGMNFEHMPELQVDLRLSDWSSPWSSLICARPVPQVQAHRLALSIVRGSIEDVDSLEPLWVAVHHAHAASMPELAPYVSDAETWARAIAPLYVELFEKPDTLLLLARVDGELVGYALACTSSAVRRRRGSPTPGAPGSGSASSSRSRSRATHRGQGIGSALLDAVDREFEALGVADVIIGLLPGNDGARRLYERRGFARRGCTCRASRGADVCRARRGARSQLLMSGVSAPGGRRTSVFPSRPTFGLGIAVTRRAAAGHTVCATWHMTRQSGRLPGSARRTISRRGPSMSVAHETLPLSIRELQRTREPLERATALPQAAFTDPRVLDWELEHVFMGGWIGVGHVDQVARARRLRHGRDRPRERLRRGRRRRRPARLPEHLPPPRRAHRPGARGPRRRACSAPTTRGPTASTARCATRRTPTRSRASTRAATGCAPCAWPSSRASS